MVWKGSGNHTRKMSAAATAPSAAVSRKWIAKARNRSRQTIAMVFSSIVHSNPAAQLLVLLRARLGGQPPFARRPRRLRRMALLRRDQRAPHQLEQPLLGKPPV